MTLSDVKSNDGTICGFAPKMRSLIQRFCTLINTIRIKDSGHNSFLLAQYQSSSDHYNGNSSILVDPSSQMMEPSAVLHPRWANLVQSLHTFINNTRIAACGHNSCLLAQYQSSSGHYMGNSSILVDPSSQMAEPFAVFHPRCTP
jgi:hypothetical protein